MQKIDDFIANPIQILIQWIFCKNRPSVIQENAVGLAVAEPLLRQLTKEKSENLFLKMSNEKEIGMMSNFAKNRRFYR